MEQNELYTSTQIPEAPLPESAPPQEDHVPEARRTYSRALLNIAIFWIIAVALQLGLKAVIPDNAPAFVGMLTTFAPMYLIAFPIYLVLSKKLPASPPPEQHRMHLGQILAAFPCCEFIAIAGNFIGIIINLILTLLLGTQTDSTMLLDGILGESSLIFVIVAVICAPIVEELMFRKILIDRVRKYGELPAILISGVMFGLFHGNFTQFFYAAGLGILFAWIYVRTGKIIHTIALHFLVNFWGSALPLILLHSIDKNIIREVLENQNYSVVMENFTQFIPFAIMVMTNYLLAFTGLILLIVYRKRLIVKPAEAEIPRKKRFPTAVCNLGFLILFAACVLEFVLQIVLK